MNILRAFIGSKSVVSGVAREMLPEVNAFVDVSLGDGRLRQSIPIDALGTDTFTTRALPGMRVGSLADFLYSNPNGRFRFAALCTALDGRQAHFKMPSEVKTIASYAAKRSAVRLDSMLPISWRYAPDGKGNGEFVRGSMSDLSRGGASLVVGRDLKVGTHVELRVVLKSSPAPLLLLGQVVRAAKIASSGKNSAGIRFLDVDAEGERAIDEFIQERQTVRRDRGVV